MFRAVYARVFFTSLLILTLLMPGQTVNALTASETVYFDESPLVITAYLATSGVTDLGAVELYNDGNEPINVTDWKIVDVREKEERVLDVSSSFSGYLEPKTHIVISRDGAVTNATYRLNGWSHQLLATGKITNLQLRKQGFKPVDLAMKTTDGWWRRNTGVSGYLTTFTGEADKPLPLDDGLYSPPLLPDGLEIVEVYPYASDCSPFDNSVLCGDYVKLFNNSDQAINLEDLVLRTDSNSSGRTSSNTISLGGLMQPKTYATIAHTDNGDKLSLTNSGGYVWFEDLWGLVSEHKPTAITKYLSASTSEQGLGYVMRSDGQWGWTTTPNPNGPNEINEPVSAIVECPSGKYRNPETGRCRNIEEAVNALTLCAEGEERNPTTNRCRKITATTTVGLTPCGDGQERNPATNRCRSIASAVAELLPCDEGYERNPATNRCRKQLLTTMPLAKFPVETIKQTAQSMAGWWAFIGVSSLAVGYGVWEWRREIRKLLGGARLAVTSLFR